MSEITHASRATAPWQDTAATVFPFPSGAGDDSGVTITVFEGMPPADGCVRAFEGHALSLHLGPPLPIRQRREEIFHEWTFRRGDLSLIPAGWKTACWTEKNADFLSLELGRGLVRQAAPDSTRGAEIPCLFSFEDPVCRELSLSMLGEAQAHGAAARMYVESAAVVLAQRLLWIGHRTAPSAHRSGLPEAVLHRAKEFLHDEMGRNPGVAELSAAVSMNVHHFSRMFKRSTGFAPHQYLSNMRLERAKQLLVEGRSRIIEIAYEIGYSNPSQFSTFFRKRTGLSPSEFRRGAHVAR